MGDIVKSMFGAVERQGYELAYIPQAIPVLGGAASIPTAIVSGIQAIIKLVQALFQYLKEGTPFFRPNDGTMGNVKFYMEDALDLGLIFVDNVVNVFTLGIPNCIFIWDALSGIVLNKNLGEDTFDIRNPREDTFDISNPRYVSNISDEESKTETDSDTENLNNEDNVFGCLFDEEKDGANDSLLLNKTITKDNTFFDTQSLIKEAEEFAKDHPQNKNNNLKNFIVNILDNKKFQSNPEQYLKKWKDFRGNTEEFRIPEDIAMRFFEERFTF
jgi:hypothetical protein